jgi:hypothetical protein
LLCCIECRGRARFSVLGSRRVGRQIVAAWPAVGSRHRTGCRWRRRCCRPGRGWLLAAALNLTIPDLDTLARPAPPWRLQLAAAAATTPSPFTVRSLAGGRDGSGSREGADCLAPRAGRRARGRARGARQGWCVPSPFPCPSLARRRPSSRARTRTRRTTGSREAQGWGGMAGYLRRDVTRHVNGSGRARRRCCRLLTP